MNWDVAQVGDGLTRYLSEEWDRPVNVSNLVVTSAGARRGNILFDANDGEFDHELVVTIYPSPEIVLFGVEAETAALQLAEAAGAPVAHVHAWSTETAWFGEPFFISSRIAGETVPRRVLRLVTSPEFGDRIGRQLGAGLAAIHSIPATDAPDEVRRPFDRHPSEVSLEAVEENLETLLDPAPTWALGLRWLRRNLPDPPARHSLVHGDTRNGNIIVNEAGLAAILDWEGCHTGDPHEDFGWLAVRTWRFGNDHLEMGGLSPRAPFREAYEEAGGEFDPHSFHWWKVFGTLRWGVGLSVQSVQHLGHAHRSVVMAASGRRSCELEYDLLRLLAPSYQTR